MRILAEKFRREHGVDELDPDEFADWAIASGDWVDRPGTAKSRCKKAITQALRSQHIIDGKGREVRGEVAIPLANVDGQTHWHWAPIYKAKPEQFRLAQQLRRKGILADCRQHQTDTESYNDFNEHGAVVDEFDYNFNYDLAEERMPTEYPDEDPEGI